MAKKKKEKVLQVPFYNSSRGCHAILFMGGKKPPKSMRKGDIWFDREILARLYLAILDKHKAEAGE